MKMNLIYTDTSDNNKEYLLYTLTTNMAYTIDGIMDFADLTIEDIENQLGFEIDYENLSIKLEEEKETKKMNKTELYVIFQAMAESMGTIELLDELFSALSDDEVEANLRWIDRNNDLGMFEEEEEEEQERIDKR